MRRGISLTEVLISMFVLMIGLLGVAAMIPAGRHEILEGAKIDNATAVGRAAFRDVKIRGYLNPANWRDETGATPILQANLAFASNNAYHETPPKPDTTPAVAIDPLGLASPLGYGPKFPSSAGADLFLTRIFPDNRSNATLAELALANDIVFRAQDDLIFTPTGNDTPPEQSVYTSANGVQPFSKAATPLKRASEGNYSWLATIVSDPAPPPGALGSQVTVSVAVFYKRDLSDPLLTERKSSAPIGFPYGQFEPVIQHPSLPTKPIKPGQWIMLAGRKNAQNPTRTFDYYRWYQVVAVDKPDSSVNPPSQQVTIKGADWDTSTSLTEAWLFDNVVTVYEKQMSLELD